MNGVQALQAAFEGAHRWFSGTMAGVTEDQANFVPVGVAHPIGELAAHVIHSEDGMLAMVRGEASLWDSGGWAARTGLPEAMVIGQDNTSARAYRADPAKLVEYTEVVFAQTDAYLASLTDGDLDGEVDLTAAGMGKMPLGQLLASMLLGNTYAHTGEISAIKGLQDSQGYPF